MMRATKNNTKLRKIDAPLYRYFQALYLALYSGDLFVDVAKRWRGFGMLYLLLVVAISTSPFAIRFIYDINQYVDNQILSPIKQLPLLYIQNGNLEFDEPMPYVIKNKEGRAAIIIDTTGKVKEFNDEHPDLWLLITKNKFYLRSPEIHFFFNYSLDKSNKEILVQNINKNINQIFDGNSWANSSRISRMKWMVAFSLYPMLMMLVYGLSLGLMFALAFIGKLFSHIVIKHDLPFKTASRLFMVSSTGTFYLFFILLVFNISMRGNGLFYMIILAIYFYYGVLCVKRHSKKMVHR